MLEFEEIPNWCAGMKLSVTYENVSYLKWEDIVEEAVAFETSCVVISVNEHELEVIKWCKENKFRKGPTIKNWGHSGRKTYCFFKQITKRDYYKYGGREF